VFPSDIGIGCSRIAQRREAKERGQGEDFSAVLDLRPKPVTRGKITASALIDRTIAAETT
jgi:hypothetical protein